LVCVSLAWAADAAPASAQTAAVLYERAQAREHAMAAAKSPAVESLRALAQSYEAITRRYPTSGYADNALWQAAGLMEQAFAQSAAAADRERAVRFLTWLRREYPSSSLVRGVDARLGALERPAPAPQAATAPSTGTDPVSVRNITQSPLPRGERITIELSREVPYFSDRVVNPDRVYFDFRNATAANSLLEKAQSLTGTMVKTVRVGRPSAGVTRVVLELAGTPRFSAFPLYEPFRLVVDLENEGAGPAGLPPAASESGVADGPAPAGSGANAESGTARSERASPPPPAATITTKTGTRTADNAAPNSPEPAAPAAPARTSSGEYSLARQLGATVSRIVIDAGHGGHDPGAQANGVTEAELVLDIALRVEKLLKQRPGLDVVLTRRTNEFIPLEERTAIANREGADLFLSIHANASARNTARGVETYFLNFATNPDAEAVAARENATSAQTMGTVPAILKAIALNNKLAESRELATILQTSLVRRLRGQNAAVRDLGVKQAPFVVLIGAQMPSVLSEISFITNRADATLLKQSGYRQHVAQALADAVLRYQASLKKITTTAIQSPEL